MYHSYEGHKVSQSHKRPGEISQTSEHMNYVCTAYTFIYTYLFTYLFTITLVAPIKIPMVVKPKCLWPCFSIAVFHCLLHKKSTSSSKLFTYLLHGAESLLRSQLILQLVKKFSAFLEPEGSSPYSQVPSTSLYPEPTPSSPHNLLLLTEDPS